MKRHRVGLAIAVVTALFAPPAVAIVSGPRSASSPLAVGSVPAAHCGPGSHPETALQGEVPRADRQSGRGTHGYSCNLSLVGRYQGEGASWVNPSYGHCAYLATRFPTTASSLGAQVVDAANPRRPRLAGTLTSAAMLGPWESLKVNQRRGLLGAVQSPGPAGNGVGYFDVYDIKHDCAHPRLLSSTPTTRYGEPGIIFGHEGN